jgi:hypothetical protein
MNAYALLENSNQPYIVQQFSTSAWYIVLCVVLPLSLSLSFSLASSLALARVMRQLCPCVLCPRRYRCRPTTSCGHACRC